MKKLIEEVLCSWHNNSKEEEKPETLSGFFSSLPSESSPAEKDVEASSAEQGPVFADTKLISRLPGQRVDQIHTLPERDYDSDYNSKKRWREFRAKMRKIKFFLSDYSGSINVGVDL